MSRTARAVEIAMLPFVVGAIYLFLLRNAILDTREVIKRRAGAWEPMEHP